jgi:hypothetical protein
MSEHFKIIDKKGEWVLNTGEVRLPDYQRQVDTPGSDLVILEPGVPTRIVRSDFLKAQPLLRLIEDPTDGEIRFKEEPVADAPQAPKAPAAAK